MPIHQLIVLEITTILIWSRRRTTTIALPQVTFFSRTTVESGYIYLLV